MNKPITLYAAGSLRSALSLWRDAYCRQTGQRIALTFGPAGLLRERLEQGEHCDLFLSANCEHPQQLAERRPVLALNPFAVNSLCVIARRRALLPEENWLDVLCAPRLRLATSTPKADPGGDYAQQLFDNIEKYHKSLGEGLKHKARWLVGGRQSLKPQGNAAAWLIKQHLTDVFIGYRSNSLALREQADFCVFDIPEPYQVKAVYMLALLSPQAQAAAEDICTGSGQAYLRRCGFKPVQSIL